MLEEVTLEFRLEKIDETRNCFLDEIKKTCNYLNYAGYLLILASTVTGCVSVSAFVS